MLTHANIRSNLFSTETINVGVDCKVQPSCTAFGLLDLGHAIYIHQFACTTIN